MRPTRTGAFGYGAAVQSRPVPPRRARLRSARPAALAVRLGLAVALLAPAGCARLGGEVLVASHNSVLPVTEETSVGQTFSVAGSAVRGVDLLVATFAAPADPQGVLTVTLFSERGGEVLDVVEVPGTQIHDNSWVAVRFSEPQPLAGRPAFEVTWDGASQLALRANVPRHPIPPDVLINDPYPGGELMINGELAAGDLAFRVVGADGAAAWPRTLVGLARGAVRGLLQRPLFAVGWLLALVGSAALAVWGLRSGRDADAPGAVEDAEAEAGVAPRSAAGAPAPADHADDAPARARRGPPAARS